MKINVLSRSQIKRMHKKDPMFHKNNWIISIFSSEMEQGCQSYSPLPNASTVLKLKFDDVTEKDPDYYIHFNENTAKKIVDFIKNIVDDGLKDMYVHCDAGVSRSGAVGYMMNEYFNKFLNQNKEDDEFFKKTNSFIMPNPEVVRILKDALFGKPFAGIEVKDYTYDEDGNKRFQSIFI